MKVLAIIPARGGSKGIPKKNSLIFDGLTLVDYAINSAIESQTIKKTIVSSDDELILNNALFKINSSSELTIVFLIV